MSFFPKTKIEYADSSAIDAFGKLRVSTGFTIFDSKQISDSQSLVWSTKNITGATMVYSSSRASTTMYVTTTSGSKSIRQTKQYFNYEPGKGNLILMTGIFGSVVNGVKKRIGYFDNNNGIFFLQDSGSLKVVIRSSVSGTPIDTEISQSQWNLDKFDGTGKTGIVLNSTQAQIFAIDFEWLGTGRVRTGFNISGSIQYGHEFHHANITDSVYMSTPNLPLRYEIENFGSTTTGSLEHICSSVISEGGYEPKGMLRTVDRFSSSLNNVSSSNPAPLISIRLGNSNTSTVIPNSIELLSAGNSNYRWAVHLNPTIGGADNANWIGITGSNVQYDVSRDITNFVTGGILLKSGYGNGRIATTVSEFESSLTLGKDIDGTSDQIVVSVQKVAASTESFFGSLTWRELV